MSKTEIIRCLKRYVAREVFRVLKNPRPAPLTNACDRCAWHWVSPKLKLR
ncbi:hypothetical protein ACIGB6_01860 [Paeniglutamicibacter gangotriensis]